MTLYFNSHFFFRTSINNISISGKSNKSAQELMSNNANAYVLTIEERNNKTETITGESISLKYDFSNNIDRILKSQNPFLWISSIFRHKNYEFTDGINYDESLLNKYISELDALNESMVTNPVNAKLNYNDGKYEIIKEDIGNKVNRDLLNSKILEKIISANKTLNLDEEKIIEAISVGVLDSNKSIQFITNRGIIKKSSLNKFQTNYTKIQAIKLKENEFVLNIALLENDNKREFLKVKTKLGLKFSLEVPAIEDSPRNILGTQLFNLIEKDEITEVEYVSEFEFMSFSVGVTAKGNLKGFARAKSSDRLKVNTDSASTLLLFTNEGNVYKIPSFLISNVVKEEILLENIIEGYNKKEKVIDVHSVKNFEEGNRVYFFTKKGMIKKTSLKEYDGNYSMCQAYKFKYENDEVISVCIYNNIKAEIVIISKKGMAIRFLSDNVNTMGRVASGVTGISLKDDDEVISGKVIGLIANDNDEIAIDKDNNSQVILITKNKEKKNVLIEEIRIQNRAGRGTNVMVINLDDEITETEFQ